MSAIDEIQAAPHRFMRGHARSGSVDPSKVVTDLHQIAPLFWAWYRAQDPNHTVLKVYFFRVTWQTLRPVFELLFGPEQ